MKTKTTAICTILCTVILSLFVLSANAQTTGEIAKGNCKACITECEKALAYCNKKGGQYTQTNIISALKDCITACKASEDYLARNSSQASKSLSLCVEACMNCAKSCESFKSDNAMRACADECRKCAGNCQKL
jgi:hypothetical protein